MTAPPIGKSTIVRSNQQRQSRQHQPGHRLLHFLLTLAERDAPALGARLAARMWMTIPKAPANTARARDGEARSSGGKDRLTEPGERVVLRGHGASEIVTESWGEGPAVYLLHGWAGNRQQFDAFVEPLVSAGFRAVSIDSPGHGESGPGLFGRGRSLQPDFATALRAAFDHYGTPHGVVAHSLGASATAISTLDGLATSRLVLISPVSNAYSGLDIFVKAAGIGPKIRAKMPRRIERITRLPAAHFDIAARAAEVDELPPALVIHDSSDRYVPFDQGVLIASAWPGARLKNTEGLGHTRILRDQAVIAAAVEFLRLA
jgi:pimeloyl-ACP methyl ester carboxylesterase